MGIRVLICGDRNWIDYELIELFVKKLHQVAGIDCIIEGEARGADKLSRLVAENLGIPLEKYPAYWSCIDYEQHTGKRCFIDGKHQAVHGRPAGVIRNTRMLNEGKPELVVSFHDSIETSKGTKDMLEQAKNAGVKTFKMNHQISTKQLEDL